MNALQSIHNSLWTPGQPDWLRVWMILDGARDERIYPLILGSRANRECLYAGNLPAALEQVVPWLVELEPDDQFTRRLLERSWGQSWGVFLRSEGPINSVRKHLRRFLLVNDYSGRRLVFRYYDPRV